MDHLPAVEQVRQSAPPRRYAPLRITPAEHDLHIRRIDLQMRAGNYDAARKVIDEAERKARAGISITLSTRLLDTDLTIYHEKLARRVSGHGVKTVGDLLGLSPPQLLALDGIKERQLAILVEHATRWSEMLKS